MEYNQVKMQLIRRFELGQIINTTPSWFQQLIKFAIVGFINTGVDFGFYFLLSRYMIFFGTSLSITKGLSYSLGVVSSYLLNRQWTFKSTVSPSHSFLPFVGINLFSILLNAVLMALFLEVFGISELFALMIVTGVTFGWNFIAVKIMIFRDDTSPKSTDVIGKVDLNIGVSTGFSTDINP
jgi:putative flippase GtrA